MEAEPQADDQGSLHDLVCRCRANVPGAWEQLYRCCLPVTYNYARRQGFSHADAEDMSQNAMITLTESIDTIDNPLAYARTVVSRRCIDRFRAKREMYPVDEHNASDGTIETRADVAEQWGEQWIEQVQCEQRAAGLLETADLLKEALIRLGDPCRSLLRSRFQKEMSYRELATTLEIKESHVGMRLSRCVDKLKHVLKAMPNAWAQLCELRSVIG